MAQTARTSGPHRSHTAFAASTAKCDLKPKLKRKEVLTEGSIASRGSGCHRLLANCPVKEFRILRLHELTHQIQEGRCDFPISMECSGGQTVNGHVETIL